MKRLNQKKPYFPRVLPKINTSSKTFISKKIKATHRRILNRQSEQYLNF